MSVALSPSPVFSWFTPQGLPAAGYQLYTYVAGTSTPQATYTDYTQTTQNLNPVVLNSFGYASVWLLQGQAYKFVLYDASGNLVWSQDQINAPALTQSVIGAILYPQTAAEIAAGVTPTNYVYPPGNILRYGTNTTPGTTDMTSAFAALALTGYVGYAPAQDYLISSTINFNINYSGLTGDGVGTRILTNNAIAAHFGLGTGSTPIYGLLFEDFRVWSTVQKTAGAVFYGQQLQQSTFRNIYAGSLIDYQGGGNVAKLWNGYVINEFAVASILGGQIAGCANWGAQVNGSNTSTPFGAEINFDDGLLIQACSAAGVYVSGGAGGVYLGRCSISLCGGYGLHISNASTSNTYPNREIFISDDCTIDTSTLDNVHIEADSVAYLEVEGCSIAGSITGCGVYAAAYSAGTVPGFKFTGSEIYTNAQDGMQISDGSLVVSGCRIFSNGANGVNLPTNAATPLLINGNNISNNTGYGVLSSNNTQTNGSIQDNVLTANNSGGAQMSIAASFTNAFIVRNNVGFVTENAGSSNVGNGNTSVVVNHGLAGTPSFLTSVLPTGQLDTGGYFYINPSSFTSTQFTVSYSVTAGAARGFMWRATMGTQ